MDDNSDTDAVFLSFEIIFALLSVRSESSNIGIEALSKCGSPKILSHEQTPHTSVFITSLQLLQNINKLCDFLLRCSRSGLAANFSSNLFCTHSIVFFCNEPPLESPSAISHKHALNQICIIQIQVHKEI